VFIRLLWQNPRMYVLWVVLVAFSICVHEYAHARTAVRFGDHTPFWYGHLSLNPLRVMGRTSLIMLLVFGFAWGRVMVDAGRLSRGRRILVSIAGPAANALLFACFVILAVLFAAVARSAPDAAGPLFENALLLGALGAQVNAFLFVFNMLPVPILDGWAVYEGLFPDLFRRIPMQARNEIGIAFLLVLFMTPIGSAIWRATDGFSLATIQAVNGLLFG